MNARLIQSIQFIPPGCWAIGMSGGADSVALLHLLTHRSDLSLRVVHLDHQTRQGQSTEDSQFVEQLAKGLSLPFDLARLDQIDLPHKPANRSAQFRAARLEWFRQVARQHVLQGVIVAHHADDQAESVMLRLLRGSGFAGLVGMSNRSTVGGLLILRPLLKIPRQMLVDHLKSIGQPWREDSSNASSIYARNRVRKLLRDRPELSHGLLELGDACRALKRWARLAPQLDERFPTECLANLPAILARESAKRWLIARGVPVSEVSPAVLDRLVMMASDAASPAKSQFPGGVTVRRRGAIIFVE